MNIPDIKIGSKLICGTCGKEFIASEDTCCITKNGYSCDWKCFSAYVKKEEKKRFAELSNKQKRIYNKNENKK